MFQPKKFSIECNIFTFKDFSIKSKKELSSQPDPEVSSRAQRLLDNLRPRLLQPLCLPPSSPRTREQPPSERANCCTREGTASG